MLRRAANVAEEVGRIGWRAFRYRLRHEAMRRIGIDRRRHPIRAVTGAGLLDALEPGVPRDAAEFFRWWMGARHAFFVDGSAAAGGVIRRLASPTEVDSLVATGEKAARGTILAFRAWEAAFGDPVDWNRNPVAGTAWPAGVHAFDCLTPANRARTGDIKLTWEVGRFLHIADVLRAYLVAGDRTLIDRLFDQIADFAAKNPLYAGPHWVSEQEVGIRCAMFAWLLFALRHDPALTAGRALLLLSQIAAGAEYCAAEIEFARRCIANNHLIAGALCLYLAGTIMPWHRRGGGWRRQGRTLIQEAVATQWLDDGGYVQPSHNYHRLALNYLLWALRLAQREGDDALARAILDRMGRALGLLNAMTADSRGRLPNWGPNDGALFCPWTCSDYADFRPTLTALRYATTATRLYPSGQWDEQLYWLWGEAALDARVDPEPVHEASFPLAGLHTLRQGGDLAVLRSGPILSRFGQQADQLHIDVWWRDRNVLLDAGSYSYADRPAHEWFRSTAAHNTVTVGGHSQMLPYRQFLFLKWPNARWLALPPPSPPVRAWIAGAHDGYKRLPQDVLHARLLADLGGSGWLVVDRLVARKPAAASSAVLHWHLAAVPIDEAEDGLRLHFEGGELALAWHCSGAAEATLARPGPGVDASWHARHYGLRQAVPVLRVAAGLTDRLVFATWFGPAAAAQPLSIAHQGRAILLGGTAIGLPEAFLEMSDV